MAEVNTSVQSTYSWSSDYASANPLRDSRGYIFLVSQQSLAGVASICVNYSIDEGATWSLAASQAAASNLSYPASAIDSQDIIHIAGREPSGTYKFNYQQFSCNTLTFGSIETVFDGTANTDVIEEGNQDIAVDGSDNIHVVWSQDIPTGTDAKIYHNKRTAGTWGTRTQLSTSFAAAYTKPIMALDSAGNIMVVFYLTAASNDLYYSYYNGTWSADTLLEASRTYATYKFSLTTDSSKNFHLTAYASSNGFAYYFKFTFSTGLWTEVGSIGASYTYPQMYVDQADVVRFIYTDGTTIRKTNYTGTWASATDFVATIGADSFYATLKTPYFPRIGGYSTQIPTTGAAVCFAYRSGGGAYYLRYAAADGFTPIATQNKNYTRESNASLPATNSILSYKFTATDYSDVATDDNIYEDQTAINIYAIFLFKNRGNYNTDDIVVTWKGKSDLACSSSTVTLQIYNKTTPAWETLDSNNTTAAGTEFTLTGTKTSSLTDYYDANLWVSCRVYQLAV